MSRTFNDYPLWSTLYGGSSALLLNKRDEDIVYVYIEKYRFFQGGFELGQSLLPNFKGKDHKMHRGVIDRENEYMKLYMDDYPEAAEILNLFSFKKDKTTAYTACSDLINQGLVIFPKGLNVRNEIEFEEEREDGSLYIRYEKPNVEEMNAIIQMDLAKEELLGMVREKRPNGTEIFTQSPEAISNSLKDDRADCVAMICYRLAQLRNADALDIEKDHQSFEAIFAQHRGSQAKKSNPFNNNRINPFGNRRGFM